MSTEQLNKYKHSIIIAYHKNKELLYYVLNLLINTIPNTIEIVIVANNADISQLDIKISSSQVKIFKINKSLLYSEAMNYGVSKASGDIITMFDQDVFCYGNWYEILLDKLLSSPKIGAVSPKLINPTNNRIIDFGIEYSTENILHPMRGLSKDHPLSLLDRKVSSACGAVMMTYKSLYKEVGGMDTTMPYICCDCDYGIQLAMRGYETWVVAKACLFHKGSSSKNNTKYSEYSYLRGDSKAMFFAKDYNLLKFNMNKYIEKACKYFKKHNELSKDYFFYNLSSLHDVDYFIAEISNSLNVNFYDVYTINVGGRYLNHIQLYDYIPLSHLDIVEPFIYFVDTFLSLKDNALWWKQRKNKNDIIIDTNGNFLTASEIAKLIV